ncbi:RING finger and WD repeat domain-containing protein 3 [Coemansia erecta]|uniref:RING finger and WD repeat domain-containing protein 3 n=1 Tax=Coemansia erecta TaxID=147472 RepID=A0A9W7Y421_9FUNG|nr:RING finger and WD repeat domain-containing protein 3 [Coemansia erecta]
MTQACEQTPSPPSLTQILEHPTLAATAASSSGIRPAMASRGQSLMSVDSGSDSGAPAEDSLRPPDGARKRSRTQDTPGGSGDNEGVEDDDDDEFQAPVGRNSGSTSASSSNLTTDQAFFPRALTTATATATANPPDNDTAADDLDVPPSSQCPICMDAWGITGDHRLVSLKCGHLYGQRCIRRWLRQSKRARCPSCQHPAVLRDLRPIYARALTAQDSQENVRLAKEVERLVAEVKRAQDDLLSAQNKYMAMRVEVKRARDEHDKVFQKARWLETENRALRRRVLGEAPAKDLDHQVDLDLPGELVDLPGDLDELPSDMDLPSDLDLPDDPPAPDDPDPPDDTDHLPIDDLTPPLLQLRAAVRLPSGGARALALDPHTPTAYVSSGTTMHRISLDSSTTTFTLPTLHASEIRAACVSPHPGTRYLLTASSDRTAALSLLACAPAHDPSLVQACSPQVHLRVKVGAPAWACAWDARSPHVFHVGGGGGRLLTFDVRKTGEPVACRVAPKTKACWADGSPAGTPNFSPIHSVVAQPDGYLAVANAQHVYRVSPDTSAPWTQVTGDAGSRTCLSLSAHGTRLAAPFRVYPATDDGVQSTCHEVYEPGSTLLSPTSREWPCSLHVPVDSPQTRMARSALWGFRRRAGGKEHVLLAAPVEARRCVRLWDASARVPVEVADLEVPAGEEIVDVAACQWPDVADSDGREGLTVLAALTTSTLRLYDVR